jgi:hypothetical protein
VLNDAADTGPLLDWNAADLEHRVPQLIRLGASPPATRTVMQSSRSQLFDGGFGKIYWLDLTGKRARFLW